MLAKWNLGDYVQLALVCAVVLPVLAAGLLSSNSRWSRAAGKVIGGAGAVAAALVALAVVLVLAGIIWLAFFAR